MAASKKEPKGTQEKNLEAVIDEVRELVAVAERKNGHARFEIGRIVRSVMDERTYGTSAVEKVAKELKLDSNTLYRYADVAKAWTKTDFGKLMKRTNAEGLPMSWSHAEVIAKEDESSRASLIDQVLAECLSVADLRVLLRKRKEKKPDLGTPSLVVVSSVSQKFFDLHARMEALAKEARALDDETFGSPTDQEQMIPAEEIEKLEQTCKSIQEAGAELTTLADHLAERLAVAKATLDQQQRAEPQEARPDDAGNPDDVADNDEEQDLFSGHRKRLAPAPVALMPASAISPT